MSLLSLEHIVQACKAQNPEAQKKLYDLYKDRFFGICCRYIKSKEDAEDVFIDAFYKIFSKIDLYQGSGSFEGWMRRIMVNESLMFLRKNANLHLTVELTNQDVADHEDDFSEYDVSFENIIQVIDELPVGYRTIFNLFVFEDFKHREIADMLGISINTSKSQLILAKKRLLEIIKKKEKLNLNFIQ